MEGGVIRHLPSPCSPPRSTGEIGPGESSNGGGGHPVRVAGKRVEGVRSLEVLSGVNPN